MSVAVAELTLTDRELRVLECVAENMTNLEISLYLGVAPATVRTHRSNITRKLRVGSTAAAMAMAFRRGWLS